MDGQIEICYARYAPALTAASVLLVTTLTVKMAEDLTGLSEEHGVKTKYMHHEV